MKVQKGLKYCIWQTKESLNPRFNLYIVPKLKYNCELQLLPLEKGGVLMLCIRTEGLIFHPFRPLPMIIGICTPFRIWGKELSRGLKNGVSQSKKTAYALIGTVDIIGVKS